MGQWRPLMVKNDIYLLSTIYGNEKKQMGFIPWGLAAKKLKKGKCVVQLILRQVLV